MAKLNALFVVSVMVAGYSADDVLDALSCNFMKKNLCRWRGDGWQFDCNQQFCYIFTDQYTSWDTIQSITFNNSRPICFHIGYSFDVVGYSTITVTVSGRKAFNTTNYDSKTEWHQANVTIPVGSSQDVLVGATRSAGYATAYISYLNATYGAC